MPLSPRRLRGSRDARDRLRREVRTCRRNRARAPTTFRTTLARRIAGQPRTRYSSAAPGPLALPTSPTTAARAQRRALHPYPVSDADSLCRQSCDSSREEPLQSRACSLCLLDLNEDCRPIPSALDLSCWHPLPLLVAAREYRRSSSPLPGSAVRGRRAGVVRRRRRLPRHGGGTGQVKWLRARRGRHARAAVCSRRWEHLPLA